ncbi:MAG: class I SAM-dependent methyltransferase [Candidatus Vecturithrix sp.]|jgi:O-methyltransferase involved in polyketide biosynthesis|nr:class I SAM-dependent methyltransferase [Candidatus Vecturithrix sp.]
MKLTDVSKSAIMTLRSHVIESQKKNPIITDPMAESCLNKFASCVSDEDITGILQRTLSSALTSHIAIRARKYDAMINEYISYHPNCVVINLGCGFDTRYWRIDHTKCTYYELDLPEIIDMKRKMLSDHLEYELLGCSILDTSWIDRITFRRNVQMIFQDPYSSLNPRMTVKELISEGLEIHRLGTRSERERNVFETLALVGLNPEYVTRFAHEFSGGPAPGNPD